MPGSSSTTRICFTGSPRHVGPLRRRRGAAIRSWARRCHSSKAGGTPSRGPHGPQPPRTAPREAAHEERDDQEAEEEREDREVAAVRAAPSRRRASRAFGRHAPSGRLRPTRAGRLRCRPTTPMAAAPASDQQEEDDGAPGNGQTSHAPWADRCVRPGTVWQPIMNGLWRRRARMSNPAAPTPTRHVSTSASPRRRAAGAVQPGAGDTEVALAVASEIPEQVGGLAATAAEDAQARPAPPSARRSCQLDERPIEVQMSSLEGLRAADRQSAARGSLAPRFSDCRAQM